ncbi:putative uncharacterized protein [Clostridium sp. CAG:1013]|jgi:putative aldouronate transport system permease protein|nr:putative uncharacterized protein [Clostridium sp. CAG:1013]
MKQIATKKIKDSFGDRVFMGCVLALTFLILCATLYPLIYVVSASFSSSEAVMNGEVYFLPVGLSLDGYMEVFQNEDIVVGFKNTVIYTVVGTAINMILTTLLAYPLSRKQFRGRKILMFLIVFTMYFNGGLIPTFLVVDKLHMVDSIWGLVMPTAISTFNLIIMRTYFENSIPEELAEAASLDGCDHFRFMFHVLLPLSTPILAVLVLYYAVGHWNQYFNALIYLRSSEKISLQLALRNILMANQVSSGSTGGFTEMAQISLTVKYAVIVVSSLPVVILYPFIQKYFVKGVMVGAIKG